MKSRSEPRTLSKISNDNSNSGEQVLNYNSSEQLQFQESKSDHNSSPPDDNNHGPNEHNINVVDAEPTSQRDAYPLDPFSYLQISSLWANSKKELEADHEHYVEASLNS